MKAKFIITAVLLSILYSCGIQNQNFNHQKFTGLKHLGDGFEKGLSMANSSASVQEIEEATESDVANLDESEVNIESNKAILLTPQDTTVHSYPNPYTPWIKRGIRRNNRFFIEKDSVIYLI